MHQANVYATILTFVTQISLPLGRKTLKASSPKLVCVLRHTIAEISTCTKKHYKDYSILVLICWCLKSNYVSWCIKIVYINHAQIYKFVLVKINQILVITVVIIKEALCFCKSEPFLSDDDIITENEDIHINNINGSYVNNI